ncbi:hypothetical protein NQ315_002310 [Exocentrus adspersus]|uniref:Sodium/nucleoside cotransporter n=1 Tax=Exocentrus adspersus TaxID=1586481 RepID=A0AAV8VTB4_9CUCU|nr:hypothetical protein NQ315_002310 [Exocentrus adspersus]
MVVDGNHTVQYGPSSVVEDAGVNDDFKHTPINDHKIIEVEKSQYQKINWFKRNSSFIINLTVLTVITAYFAWATYYYIKHTGYDFEIFNSTTCDGYGFLVILYGLYVYGVLYSYVGKPIIVPLVYKNVWVPVTNLLKSIRFGQIIFYASLLVATVAYLVLDTRDNRNRLVPISGLCVFLLIGYASSSNRSMIPWRTVVWGLVLQFVFGLLTIRWDVGRNILQCLGDKVNILTGYAFDGAAFTYGDDLIYNQGVFAFKALSTIYLLSLLVNILYYYGIMQTAVGAIGNFLQWIMGTSICESVNSAANIFLGQTEAPLLIAPYLKEVKARVVPQGPVNQPTPPVLGSVLAAYVSFGARAQDLITSSIMSAPAALCFSKLTYPETEEVRVHKKNIHALEIEYDSVLDAASKGAVEAFKLVTGIIASVIAFLAFIYVVNGVLGWLGGLVGFVDGDEVWSLEAIVGKIFIPISYIMGVPWEECENVGKLIGIKTMVNEFVAFQRMQVMIKSGELSERTKVIATYAICGFSNPGSIGIQLSALGALAPSKREAITRLVFRAFWGGAVVCFMTACIAGALMPDNTI